VAVLGPLDWGPVFGGYLAALLLAAAYTAIGLFISSRTDNQIVALIATALLGGLFYVVGTTGVTDFAGEKVGTVLRAIGAGSRFESIQRGVIDLRDLIYYLTLAGVFLTLNILSLLSQRWSTGEQTRPQREGATTLSLLVALNLIVTNVWIYPLRALRVDLTQQHEYSLSTTTRDLLNGLQEPLLIRGYFSEKTHPLLAPLVPQVRDMLEEYRIASGGKVQVEIIDPAQDAEKEAEANQTYGISPTPFQVSGRYEASVINSYFDILLRYGDQSSVLNFQDLIEVQYNRDGTLDVHLRNLEYDLTRSIKKIVYGFQSVDAVLAALPEPAQLTLYVTSDTLPEQLAGIPETVQKVANDLATQSNGKFTFQQVDPDTPNSPVSRQQIYERYGLQAIPVSLFSDESFYLDMALKVGEKEEIVSVSGYTEADIRTAIEAALKRAAPGFLKVIGLWTPPATPTQDMFGQLQQPLASWDQLNKALGEEYEVQSVDLSSGQVPPNINVLVLIAPQGLGEKELYAVDQYLMRGGAVIVATSDSKLSVNQYTGSLTMEPLDGTLSALLAHYGVTVEPLLVLDQQNAPFPMQVSRTVNGVQVQEIQPLDYPFFVDIRSANMAAGNPIVSNLTAVTLNWAAPLTVDPTRTAISLSCPASADNCVCGPSRIVTASDCNEFSVSSCALRSVLAFSIIKWVSREAQ
jgi:ABC-2 type transport system permease protein